MTTSDFTPLDSLKECAARGHLTLSHVIRLLNIPDALGLPGAIEQLTKELTELHDVLCHESIVAHVDVEAGETEFYSDGRPVRTQLELEPDVVHQQIWSADPNSPRDRPQIVMHMRTPSDTVWRIAILRPGEVDAMRVDEVDEG
ncbi:hypothetical protein [Mycobacterium paraintracellulare]|uniref:hypothetical protein n=1 Tax=Mycobacterium paraintracellulare TaxID=1138383 RepID=UPI00191606CA|nr:hypothetical protein [Mycobacterium paraintracellulare]